MTTPANTPNEYRPGTTAALEPELTRFDLRVLNALGEWPEDLADTLVSKRLDFRSAWVVAERISEYDVATVRDTLRGLVHLGYAEHRRWGAREEWIKSWRWREKCSTPTSKEERMP